MHVSVFFASLLLVSIHQSTKAQVASSKSFRSPQFRRDGKFSCFITSMSATAPKRWQFSYDIWRLLLDDAAQEIKTLFWPWSFLGWNTFSWIHLMSLNCQANLVYMPIYSFAVLEVWRGTLEKGVYVLCSALKFTIYHRLIKKTLPRKYLGRLV